MATAAASSPVFTAVRKPRGQAAASLSPASISFQGLRPLTPGKARKIASAAGSSSIRRNVTIKAELNPSVVISLSTGLSLFLGRFVFFNFQRENVAKQVPEQNGLTHFEAGDTRAKEYVSLLKSNDPVGFNIVDVLAWGSIGHIVAYYIPVGFNIVDVLAWGSIGHIVAYYILATTSNGYDPSFFG